MSFTHEYSRLPFSMFDIGGVLHHSRYLSLFEDLRERYLITRGFPYSELMKEEMHLPLTRSTQEFKRPVIYDQSIHATLDVTTIGQSRFSILHKLKDSSENILHECTTEHACVEISTGRMKAVRIPERLRSILEKDLLHERASS